jgi:hypothetical protein
MFLYDFFLSLRNPDLFEEFPLDFFSFLFGFKKLASVCYVRRVSVLYRTSFYVN